MTRHVPLAFAFALALALAAPAAGAEPPVALKGYDTVAYFALGRPVPGTAAHTLDWDGRRWRFASERHRQMFRADPDRYAPRFAGHCTVSLADGARVEADPLAWTIVDGRLYLALSPRGAQRVEQDAALRERAAAAWQASR